MKVSIFSYDAIKAFNGKANAEEWLIRDAKHWEDKVIQKVMLEEKNKKELKQQKENKPLRYCEKFDRTLLTKHIFLK